MKVESDQQVRTEAHALPTHKHQSVIVPQNQCQHGEHKQIQISEETVVTALMRHVSGRVNVNQHSDPGHKQQPDAGEWIEQEACVSLKWGRSAVVLKVSQVTGIRTEPGINNV